MTSHTVTTRGQPPKYAKYLFAGEIGDVPEHNDTLKALLFTELAKSVTKQGENIDKLPEKVTVIGNDGHVLPVKDFMDAGLHPAMLENVQLCGYEKPTAIQQYAMPTILMGHNSIIVAQTGTGKTAAYLIPILSRLMGKYKKLAAPRPGLGLAPEMKCRAEPLVLIIAPTRELALQIYDHARRLCYRTMLRPVCVFGGGQIGGEFGQVQQLHKGCDVLIATLGRLIHFAKDTRLLSMRRVQHVVLDEADELLDPDWEEDLERVLYQGDANLDADRCMTFLSATFRDDALETAKEYLGEGHIRLELGERGTSHKNIIHTIVDVNYADREEKLYEVLSENTNMKRTIVFCNTKMGADMIDSFLYQRQLPVICTHAGRLQEEREKALRMFKEGTKAILVTTAMFARGIDIADVTQIINFDLPSMSQGGIVEFIHRIGRTARMGNTGHAISFVTERNADLAGPLVKVLEELGQKAPEFLVEHMKQFEEGEAGMDGMGEDESVKTQDDGDGDGEGDGNQGNQGSYEASAW